MSAVVTVYVCDNDQDVRESLTFLLEQEMLTVSAHASGPELLAAVDAAPEPFRGIFLLDQDMAPMRGSQVHAQLLARGLAHRSPVLFLSGRSTLSMAVEAMRMGAVTYLEKPFTGQTILPWVHEALETEAQWFEKICRSDHLRALWNLLTPRQKEVAELVVDGQLNKTMAWDMVLAERTIEEHRSKMLDKLGVRSAPELATLIAEMRACGTGPALAASPDQRRTP